MSNVRNEVRNSSASGSADAFSENNREDNILRISETVRRDIVGCDLLFCLFHAALNSYKVERCLKPFPPGFECNNMEVVERLRLICGSIPSLRSILTNPEALSTETLTLLNWLFTQRNKPFPKLIDINTFQLPNGVNVPLRPAYIFEMIYPQQIIDEWNIRKENHNVIMALHGSKLENFYSILRFGLQQHLANRQLLLFGEGIYLSTEFSVSVHFAPFSSNWPRSILGSKLSILALCEILDDKEKVKRRDKNDEERCINPGSIAGKLPEKYIIVTDNEVIKVKYLLVYKEKENSLRSWAFHNMGFIFLVLYFFLLCFIGSYRNIPLGLRRLWNRHLRKYFSYQ